MTICLLLFLSGGAVSPTHFPLFLFMFFFLNLCPLRRPTSVLFLFISALFVKIYSDSSWTRKLNECIDLSCPSNRISFVSLSQQVTYLWPLRFLLSLPPFSARNLISFLSLRQSSPTLPPPLFLSFPSTSHLCSPAFTRSSICSTDSHKGCEVTGIIQLCGTCMLR